MMDQMYEAENKIREIAKGTQLTNEEFQNLAYMAVFDRKHFNGATSFLMYCHKLTPEQTGSIENYVALNVEIAPV